MLVSICGRKRCCSGVLAHPSMRRRRLRTDVHASLFLATIPPRSRLCEETPDRATSSDHYEMPFALDRLMHGLSQARPIFHSREDFRHSLAAHIPKVLSGCQVQLKFPISIQGKNHDFDIWLESEKLGIRLIYTTRGLDLDWGNERYLLREHGGQPPRRYEFLNASRE